MQSDIVQRLDALIQRQRDARGDMFYKGSADPELVDARAEITRLTEALLAAEEEKKALREKWAALDKALADNIIETDQPHRVRWEGEWHYGPLADAYFAMIGAVRDCARTTLKGPSHDA